MEKDSLEIPPVLIINSKVTQEDTTRFALFHHYSRAATKIIIAFAVLLIVFMNGMFLFVPDSGDKTIHVLYFIVIFTLLFVPALIYIKARKNYVTQKNFSDPIQWRFGHESIEAVAETFSSTFTWESLYKVSENKHAFLLYQSSSLASIIPKRDMSEEQISQFRHLLREIPHLKSELLSISTGIVSGNNEYTIATKGIRIVNAFIDTIAFLLLWALITFALVLITIVFQIPDEKFNSLMNTPWYLLLPLYLGYYAFAELKFQKTIGKLFTRTKVISSNGNELTFKQILIRTLSRIIPFEFITFLFSSHGLHDQLSNTRVIQLPKRKHP